MASFKNRTFVHMLYVVLQLHPIYFSGAKLQYDTIHGQLWRCFQKKVANLIWEIPLKKKRHRPCTL